jgi:hypothetical protein
MKRIKLIEDHSHVSLPEAYWSGQMREKQHHGRGQLYEFVEGLGLVKTFDGIMDTGTMTSGKAFAIHKTPTSIGIYLAFDGDFSVGQGTLYSHTGTVLWKGDCSNRVPAGSGTATVRLWNKELSFKGICVNGTYSGTLTLPGTLHFEYTGEFNSRMHPDGRGTLDYFGNFFDGTFVDNDTSTSFHGTAFVRETFLGQKIFEYKGTCILDGSQMEFHGEGTVVIRYNGMYYFFKATFADGAVIGTIEVSSSSERDGNTTLLGLYDDLHNRITTYTHEGLKTYEGDGYLQFDQEPVFVRDGYGSVFVRGKRRFTSSNFRADTYANVLELYDEDERLLWQLQNTNFVKEEHSYMDSFDEWPYLNGYGTIFGADGRDLYNLEFNHSKPVGIKALLTILPSSPISGTFTDPITLEPIAKNRVCILINANKTPLLLKSAVCMWESGPMIDPMTNVPGFRFRKVKVVDTEA